MNDDIRITCPIHENENITGVCEELSCSDKLFCNKCIQDENSCFKTVNHKIIPLITFFSHAANEEEKNIMDPIDLINNINKSQTTNIDSLKEKLISYTKSITEITNLFLSFLKDYLLNKLKRISMKNNDKLNELHSSLILAEKKTNTLEEIPKDITLSSVKLLFKENNSSKVKQEEFVSLLKKVKSFSFSKLSEIKQISQQIIYCKNLSENKLTNAKKKNEIQLEKFELSLKSKLNTIKENIIPDLEPISLFRWSSPYSNFNSCPYKLEFAKDITDKCQKNYSIDNTFSVFKAFNNRYYLAYICKNTIDIEIIDLDSENNNNVVQTINACTNKQNVFLCRHFPDVIKKLDYLLTTSGDKSTSVWILTNYKFELYTKIEKCHNSSTLYSALILFDIYEKQDYIITSVSASDCLKVWTFNGSLLKEIGDKTESSYFINYWHNRAKKKYYIINATTKLIKIYDFHSSVVIHTLSTSPTCHISAFIFEINYIPYLFEIDSFNTFRIFNVDDGTLHKELKFNGVAFKCLCFWSENYVLVGGTDKNLKVVDIKDFSQSVMVASQESIVRGAQKLLLPQFGETLITMNGNGKLKLWKVGK